MSCRRFDPIGLLARPTELQAFIAGRGTWITWRLPPIATLTVLCFSFGDWPEAERRDKLHDFVVRNSADQEPEAQRRERLCDLYVRNIVRMNVEPSPLSPMNIEAKFRAFPELGLATIANSPMCVWRTPAHVVNDDLVLAVNLAGDRNLSQRGFLAASLGYGAMLFGWSALSGRQGIF